MTAFTIETASNKQLGEHLTTLRRLASGTETNIGPVVIYECKFQAALIDVELFNRAAAVSAAESAHPCPVCFQRMVGQWQPALRPGGTGTVLLTCDGMYTYDVRDLGGLNLGGDQRDGH